GYLLCLNSIAVIGSADCGLRVDSPNGVSCVIVSAATAFSFASGDFSSEKYSDTPLKVMPIAPAVYAWLCPSWSHVSVPGTIVCCSWVAYLSPAIVSLESSAILPFSSATKALCVHSSHEAKPLASPSAWPRDMPNGCPAFCSFWQRSRNFP